MEKYHPHYLNGNSIEKRNNHEFVSPESMYYICNII